MTTLMDVFRTASVRETEALLEELHRDTIDRATARRITAQVRKKCNLPQSGNRRLWRTVAAVAACAAMLIGLGSGTYVVVAEQREYRAAVAFFDMHALPTEGLTRNDIKAVYRDITANIFSHSKTAEVITDAAQVHVPGYVLPQELPTAEQLEMLWEIYTEMGGYRDADGCRYDYDYETQTFSCYSGNTLQWSVTISEFFVDGHVPLSDGILLHGHTASLVGPDPWYTWIAKVDNNGRLLWKRQIAVAANYHTERLATVVEHSDGSFAIFNNGCGWNRAPALIQCTADGEVTANYHTLALPDCEIMNAMLFDGGYLVQCRVYTDTGVEEKLVKIDREGNVSESFSYETKDAHYFFTDMLEYDGRLYLSAYAMPCTVRDVGNRLEATLLLDGAPQPDDDTVGTVDITAHAQEKYTAVLLVCDPDKGAPVSFYTVDAARGGKLAIGPDGTLMWEVHSVVSAVVHRFTSAYIVSGTTYVSRYTFDATNTLITREDTDRMDGFHV